MEFWWAYLLIGLTAGVLGAMLGVGGGLLMVPAMYFFLHLPFKSASAMSLVVMIPMALTATALNIWKHDVWKDDARNPLVPVLVMAAAAVAGAYLGGELAKKLEVMTLRRIFAVLMVVAAVYMAFFRPEQRGTAPSGASGAAAPLAAWPTEGKPNP
jgi:hypothetical protein